MLHDAHVAFIGGGVMGEAIIKSLLRSAILQPHQIALSEPNPERRGFLSEIGRASCRERV